MQHLRTSEICRGNQAAFTEEVVSTSTCSANDTMLAGKFLDGLEEIRRTLKINFNEGIDTFVSVRKFWDARSADHSVCVVHTYGLHNKIYRK